MKSRFSGFVRVPYKSIVLRKEIKRILVWFPCAEQGFCIGLTRIRRGVAPECSAGHVKRIVDSKKPIANSFDIRDLFNEWAFV